MKEPFVQAGILMFIIFGFMFFGGLASHTWGMCLMSIIPLILALMFVQLHKADLFSLPKTAKESDEE